MPKIENEALQALMDTDIDTEDLRPENDDELAKLLQVEAADASSYRTIDDDRKIDGYGYYYADRNYRNYTRVASRQNTSRMVSKDVAEAIDDMMPNLMRVLLSNDQIVEFEATDEQSSAFTAAATAAINAEFRKQMDFKQHLQDFIKDGLITGHGVFEVQVIEPREIPESVQGVMPESLAAYTQDPRVRLEVNKEREDGRLDITMWRGTPRQFRAESVPASDLLVSGDAVSLDQATPEGGRYVALRRKMTVGAAIAQWPDKTDLWLKAAQSSDMLDNVGINSGLAADTSYLEDARGDQFGTSEQHGNLFAKQIEVLREYYRCDMDGDKWPELLAIIRVGDTIIHREPAVDNPFAAWTPYRVPHTYRGEGQADKVRDLQDYKTAFWRIANDSAAMSAMQRYAINEAAASARPEIPFISDLLRFEPGSPVRTPGNPGEMISPLTGQDVTAPAMQALQYADGVKEGWTGQSRRQRGLDPEAVANESGVKYDKILSAGNGRIEFLARNLAEGIEAMASKMLRTMVAYGPEQDVLIKGVWTRINPQQWTSGMLPIVHISGATGSIDLEVQYCLMMIQQLHQFVGVAGSSNPWVGHEQLAEAIRELVESLGFRDTGRFIKRPSPQDVEKYLQGLAQQKDPKVQIEEMKAEVEHARMQAESVKDKYRLDIDRAQGLLDTRTKARTEAAKIKAAALLQDEDLAFKRWMKEKDVEIARIQAAAQGEDNGTADD